MFKPCIFILIALMPLMTLADIYKFTDSDGRVYYDIEPRHSLYKRIIRTKAIKSKDFKSITNGCNESTITKDQKKVIEEAIKDGLKDPYSAHFKWVKKIHICNYGSFATANYCAFVNAKNSFGGYIGHKPFKVKLTRNGKNWAVENTKFIDSEIDFKIECLL